VIEPLQVWVVTDGFDWECMLLVLKAARKHPSHNGMLYKCLVLDSWGRDTNVPWLDNGALGDWHEHWFYERRSRRVM
jgi:hypothetical protein